MPMIVSSTGRAEAAAFAPELAPRNCTLHPPYRKRKVREYKVSSDIIAYASPDSSFAVTKRLFDAARKSILIGIYDFSADHIKQLVLAAMRRNVKVQLMLDIDGKTEQVLFRELRRFGANCVAAPACSSKRAQVFRSSHEKVIVIDDEWSLVQSGNYSENSIPLNTADGANPQAFLTGNRDMGLAVKSRPLAKFFRKILESDIELELSGAEAAAEIEAAEDTFIVESAPDRMPKKIFPSKTFKLAGDLAVLPVLSPDNYMAVVPGLLAAAKRSVLIEQQYIRAKQSDIVALLNAIGQARAARPNLDVRIVLGKVFSKKDLPKEQENLELLAKHFKLKIQKNIRFINTRRLVHCRNKLILIDGDGVLVSSQNWSNAAVTQNREAGLWLRHAGIARYFRGIFETDWDTAVTDPGGKEPETASPETVAQGGFIRVMAGDYAEV